MFAITGPKGWYSLSDGELLAPVIYMEVIRCLEFTYTVDSDHSFSKATLSVFVNSKEVWFADNGIDPIKRRQYGQVSLPKGNNEVVFVSGNDGEIAIKQTRLTDGACVDMSM